jgi:hypothetical protein
LQVRHLPLEKILRQLGGLNQLNDVRAAMTDRGIRSMLAPICYKNPPKISQRLFG